MWMFDSDMEYLVKSIDELVEALVLARSRDYQNTRQSWLKVEDALIQAQRAKNRIELIRTFKRG